MNMWEGRVTGEHVGGRVTSEHVGGRVTGEHVGGEGDKRTCGRGG